MGREVVTVSELIIWWGQMSDSMTRAVLAFCSLVALMMFVGAIIFVSTLKLSDTMIGVVLGLLGSYVKDSFSYYFGTTAGSAAKDAVIAKQQTNGGTK